MVQRRSRASRGDRAMTLSEVELQRNQQRDDDGEQRSAFDERRKNQRTGLDGTGDFRLAGHSLGGRTTDPADAEAGANDGETGTDRGAHHRPGARVAGVVPSGAGDFLQERKNAHLLLQWNVDCLSLAPSCWRLPSPSPGAQRESLAARPATRWRLERPVASVLQPLFGRWGVWAFKPPNAQPPNRPNDVLVMRRPNLH